MESTITNGQTCLEKRGYEERHEEIDRSDYNISKQYSSTHKDAISDGDPQGKGAKHGGHTHWTPNCNRDTHTIDYSNFATYPTSEQEIGGYYDIKGRNGIGGRERNTGFCLYQRDIAEYGASLVDTTVNREDGQYKFGDRIGVTETK